MQSGCEAEVASGVCLSKAHLGIGQRPRLGAGARPGAGSSLPMSPDSVSKS